MLDRQDAATFTALARKYPPAIAEIAQAARQYILDLMPGAYEIVWPVMKVAGYGTGPKKLSEHYAWIAPYEKHVVLGLYYGRELADPKGLLEGTGAKMRHVKLRTTADLQKPGLRELLVAAAKHRVPPLRVDADADLAAARKAALAGPSKKLQAQKTKSKKRSPRSA